MDNKTSPHGTEAFARAVLEGLARPHKAIASGWLYDARGSVLFEEITDLPEYYPTRTETAIFTDHADAIAGAVGAHAVLVEYGAGAAVKTRILLDALREPAAYVALDISAEFLRESTAALEADYPALKVVTRIGDFTDPAPLTGLPDGAGRCVGFFPGSTIGNLTDEEIGVFLRAARQTLGPDGRLILGADLAKSPDILLPAYDDAAGVTAAFNLNLLTRINRELDGDFDLAAFAHEARWNSQGSQIEMHLVSLQRQTVRVRGETFGFAQGETIHTEISRKFAPDDLARLVGAGGWRVEREWRDRNDWFCVLLLA